MLTSTVNYPLTIILPQSFGPASITSGRSDTSATSSSDMLQTGSPVPSYALSWTILDHCNAILYGVTEFNISRLQRVQNSLARTVCAASYRASCAGLGRSLHWLPVKERITYKGAAMIFKTRFHHKPIYLAELLVDYVPSRALRSTDKLLLVEPRTKTLTASEAMFPSGMHYHWASDPRSNERVDLFCRFCTQNRFI